MSPRSPLDLPSVGTSGDDFIHRCDKDRVDRERPPDPEILPAFAVAISGGGFRASLTGMGVLRFLADAGLLGRTRYSSSVSGGSITNGLFALGWSPLAAGGFDGPTFDQAVLDPLVSRISNASLKGKLLRNVWRIVGPTTRTDVLAHALADWFFGETELHELPDACRFIVNAANLTTGVRFGFENDVVGDYVLGSVPAKGTRIRLATAVAASAAVPGAFAAMRLRGLDFPCAEGRIPLLVDGGAYDNMGLEPVDDLDSDVCLVAVNAGGTFRTGRYAGVPILRDLKRANSLLYRQSTGLRMRHMVERFRAWEKSPAASRPEWARQGVLFSLGTTIAATEEWSTENPETPSWLGTPVAPEEWRQRMALVPTSFDRFDADLCRQLVYRGWWLAGATLSAYHRDLLPARLPTWRLLP